MSENQGIHRKLEIAGKSILLDDVAEDGRSPDLSNLAHQHKKVLLEKILAQVHQDNQQFLRRITARYNRVGLELPKMEVRFEELSVEGDVYVGSRALPTLLNSTLNFLEALAGLTRLYPSKKKVHRILHGVTGTIKPSRMTLLLGPPSSGKTTLLRSLAGMLYKKLRMSGSITYNGRQLSEFIPQRSSSYISQHDIHMSEMTVRETLDFSRQCSGVGNNHELMLELLKLEKDAGIKPDPDIDAFMKATALELGQATNLITHYILKVLGLDICADTLVGDEMRRGISGGQKKRLTTGEMMVGPNRTLFMDDISTGLDSSTTFEVVMFIREMVHVMDATVLISLLQPAPEVFDLFDDIILLSEGLIIYQGPREHVLEFFESMGFRCPQRKGIADFLQEVASKKDQDKYWSNENQRPFRYISALEFSNSFKTFHIGQQIYEQSKTSHPATAVVDTKIRIYGVSNWRLFKACFSREWLLMKRNSFLYIFKTTQIAVMAMICMSVFFRTQMQHKTIEDGGKYFNALFFSLIIVTFNGMAEMALTVSRIPVLIKQREFLLYPPWAFGLPYIILRLPLSLLETGIWVAFTYYPIGFAPGASRFFGQLLAFGLTHHTCLAVFRFIAVAARTIVYGNTLTSIFFLVILVLGGFIISKDDIQPWWKWGPWVSPMMYAQNAIAINEFLDPRWSIPNYDTNVIEPTVGTSILKSKGMFLDSHWYWISIGALFGLSLLFNALFILVLRYLNATASFQVVMPEEDAEDKTMKKIISTEEQGQSTTSKTMTSGQVHSRGMVLPFQPISLAFSHVNYYVDIPNEMKNKYGGKGSRLQLLCDVSGAFRPGILTALVGVSGAGKTTLLDVLSGRKTQGYIEGNITVSGYPKNQASFARISGYCEQNDIHSPYITVHESLLFSAWLRLAPEIKQETRKMFVEEVMELVELNVLRNALVGSPGVDGLSTEQRKRLTIAVELVSNPSIIFMDEPTSGLDARSAAIVMRTVRNTVDTGRTVLCTIHQPSIDIFESFDELLLMKTGGKLIYAGPLGQRSQKLIDYFQTIPGIPNIKEGQNPATWVLEITSPSAESNLNLDFGQLYISSPLFRMNEELVKELSIPVCDSKDLSFPSEYAQSFAIQIVACFKKQLQSYWRNPDYNCTRFFMTLALGILFGSMFWNKGLKIDKQQDVLNLLGGLYSFVVFHGTLITNVVPPIIATERTVFYRERAAGMYSAFTYALTQVSIEIVYGAVQSLLYSFLLFSMVGFEWQANKFLWFIYFMFMCSIYFALYGMMVAALTPNLVFANIVISFIFCLWNLFSGFIVPKPLTPVWWRWYYWVCPMFWTIYGLVMSQLEDKTNLVNIPGQSSSPLPAFLEEKLGFEQGFLLYIAVAHVGFVLIFFFVFVCSIRFLNYQNR
ncbi:hypothetical protein J5N97_012235 [Dioscorea zingiberensis]|uniref:ABC transporter domain-containing protein n=1 Tax=Dioscorea zingiberensis TaxID=325984 RepID=A0A9D5CNL4_9LILI|nr:hypothetical protein J5N97_012235 [Dioscorea zingiberensis]